MEKMHFPKKGMMVMDQHMLSVPLRQLKRITLLSHKYSEYGLSQIKSELRNLMSLQARDGEQDGSMKAESVESLKKMITLTENLMMKMAKIECEKGAVVRKLLERMQYFLALYKINSVTSKEFKEWANMRFESILATYILRNGYMKTAELMTKDSRVERLIDFELFVKAKEVEDSLRRNEITKCLKWCSENKANIEESKSTLEFGLRLQEYIELVREGRREEAVAHSRKHLSQWKSTQLPLINSASALLIYPPKTPGNPYESFYGEERWGELINNFKSDYLAVNNFPRECPFVETMQAGLTALKTPMCFSDDPGMQSPDCPVCRKDTFGVLAADIPNVHQVNSVLIDSVTREIMDDENPPLSLPNGFVYGRKHLKEIASMNNGIVVCPKTGVRFKLSSCRKVFIS